MSWDRVPLQRLLKPVARPVPVVPGTRYRLLGVQWYAKGFFVREEKDGSEIRALTLYRVKEGDFVYNRLFAWKGSFALATESDAGGFVSNEFPCFEIDRSVVEPGWLCFYFLLEAVWNEALAGSSGGTPTSRNRLKEDRFLAMEIPLPPLPEQRRIAARLNSLSRLASEALEASVSAGREADALLQAVRRKLIGDPTSDWLPLRTYVEQVENGWSPLADNRVAEHSEWAVLKVGSVSFGSFREDENKALPPHVSPRTDFEVHPGDFLMSRANTRELVGACVLVERTRPRLMLSDKLFRFRFRRQPTLDRGYLLHVLRSPALRDLIETAATGTSPTMKNISKEKVLELPIPPGNEAFQQRIADFLNGLAGRIAVAGRLRAEALEAFDQLTSGFQIKLLSGEG